VVLGTIIVEINRENGTLEDEDDDDDDADDEDEELLFLSKYNRDGALTFFGNGSGSGERMVVLVLLFGADATHEDTVIVPG